MNTTAEFCRTAWIIARRELQAFFLSPVAYVFLVIFLFMAGFATLYTSDFLGRGQADLTPFFSWHPWLFLLLAPAIGMGLWAEERRSGTLELLLTYPVSVPAAVAGKFLGAWLFLLLALALTFPVPVVAAYFGDPDNGQMVAGYLGSALVSALFLAIAAATSAVTRNQVVSYILALVLCVLLVLCGHPPAVEQLRQWLPLWLVHGIVALSVPDHLAALEQGVVMVRDLAYFLTIIIFALVATGVAVRASRAG